MWLLVALAGVWMVPGEARAQAPTVSLTASPSAVSVPDTINLTATASSNVGPTPYYIRVIDDDSGAVLTSCGSGTTCRPTVFTTWSENADPKPRHYHAEIWSSSGGVASRSPQVTVEVRRFEFDLTLTADPAVARVPDNYTLTAATDRDVGQTPYYIRIFDDRNGQEIKSCSSGKTCQIGRSSGWETNADPSSGDYHAEVSTTADTAGRSSQVSVGFRRLLFTVSLSFSSPTTGSDGRVRYTATATSNRDVGSTPYYIKIREEGAEAASCGSGTACTTTAESGSSYRASVEDTDGRSFGTSSTWTVTDSGPREEALDDLDLVQLAALFGGPQAICDALLVYPGSHAAGSSLSDQQLACEAGVREGKAGVDLLRAIAAVGGAAGTGALWYLLREGERPSPAPGTGTTEDSIAPRRLPVPPPVLSQQQRLADALIERNAGLDQTRADAIARQCLWLTGRVGLNGRRECERLPLFASGADVPEPANHDLEALAKQPVWVKLNRELSSTKPGKGWQNSQPECAGQTSPQVQCDEYPFFGTEQGGPLATVRSPRPDLKPLDGPQNTLQGSRYSGFITKCAMQTGAPQPAGNSVGGDPFLGIPLPPDSGLPTLSLCNGKTS